MASTHAYADWCRENGCDHAHCPEGCEHPQPFVIWGILYCRRCWYKCDELVRMQPCRPETCEEVSR